MNGSYYQNPTFPGAMLNNQEEDLDRKFLPIEQSSIENILRLNKGKKICVYVSFPGSEKLKDKEFKGIIEESGRDHLIISNPQNGEWDLIPFAFVNYFNFEEKITLSN